MTMDLATVIDDSTALEEALRFLEEDADVSVYTPLPDALAESTADINILQLTAETSENASQVAETVASTDKPKRAKAKRPPGYNSNQTRENRQRELRELRHQVRELERQLAALRLGPPRLTADNTPAGRRATKRRAVWREIATHQRMERQRAEEENVELKAVLASQLLLKSNLEKTLTKRAINEGMRFCGFHQSSAALGGQPMREFGYDLLQELIRGVSTSYNELDDICQRIGISQSEFSYFNARMREGGHSGVVLEIYQNKVLPFSALAAGDVVWKNFSHIMRQVPFRRFYGRSMKNTGVPDDMIVESIGMECNLDNTLADIQALQVLRRYVETDRVTLLWNSLHDPVRFGGEPIEGKSYREKGFMLIQTPKSLDPTRYCILTTCYVITPVASCNDAFARGLYTFVKDETAAGMAANHQLIEMMLLSDGITPNPSTSMEEEEASTLDDILRFLEEHSDVAVDTALVVVDPQVIDGRIGSSWPVASAESTDEHPFADCVKSKRAKAKKYDTSNELRRLRREAEELEAQLQALRQRQSAMAAKKSKAQPLTVWRETATHQRIQRQRAEEENIELKAALLNLIPIQQSLQKLLNKRAVTEGMRVCGLVTASPSVSIPYRNVRDFASTYLLDLLEGIQNSRQEIDSVCERIGVSHLESSYSDARIVKAALGGVVIEIFQNKVLPCSSVAAGELVWSNFAKIMRRVPFRDFYERNLKDVDAEDTVVETLGQECTLNNTVVEIHGLQALRRHVEDTRSVVLWNSIHDPVRLGDHPLSGNTYRERGFTLIRPPKTLDPTQFSILTTCYHITPESSSTDELAQRFQEFLKMEVAAGMAANHHQIENMLLQAAPVRDGLFLKERRHPLSICFVLMDDTATLDDVLRFLDELSDATGDATEKSASPVSIGADCDTSWLDFGLPVMEEQQELHVERINPKQTKPKRSTRYNSNQARAKRQQELQFLRIHAQTLEQQLKALREQGITSVPAETLIWREIATHQRDQRQLAEKENAELKAVMQSLLLSKGSFEKMLHKRAICAGMLRCGLGLPRQCHALSYRSARDFGPDNLRGILDDIQLLSNDIDAICARIDTGFLESSYGDVHIREDSNGSVVMEIYRNNVLPLPAQMAGELVWKNFSKIMTQVSFRRFYERKRQNTTTSEGVVVESLGMESQLNSTVLESHGLQVLRRCEEEERNAVLWSSVHEPIRLGDQSLSGKCYRDRGFTLIRKPKTLDPTQYSILTTCYIVTLEATHTGKLSRQVQDFLKADYATGAAMNHRHIENMLLRNSVGS
ncbi:hypothetical protein Poli38472_000507 [Pythium oligandrum]|uniref:Uncharacterized protein n=1 Tax=Pythium oligandrum TaxID=41045 RepID=A0A8K1FEE8_PYTOL|nr:hypothetical protein Poli38472_000507 [Pythium oligandrum]|eukprot:TMW60465.1 hypothetical protein Poli38472_000507 [Pythium oligandrum]